MPITITPTPRRLAATAVLVLGGIALFFVSAARTAVPVRTEGATFHACYVPDVGAVYMIKIPGLPDDCLSSAHVEISWGQEGKQGPPGPEGPPGPQGEPGPSAAFHTSSNVGPSDIAESPAFTTVLSLQLPAGSYAVSATLVVHNEGTTGTPVRCRLVPGTIGEVDNYPISLPAGDARAMTVIGVRTFQSAGAMQLQCRKGGGAGTVRVAESPRMIAIAIGSVTAP